MKQPDPKHHQALSFMKSAIRILGYIFLPIDILAAASMLSASEGIGILEELV